MTFENRPKETDVYAYEFLLWGLTHGQTPFSADKYEDGFCQDIYQIDVPPINPSLCLSNLTKLIQNCWNKNQIKRPIFEDIYQSLKDNKIVFESDQKDKNNYINKLFDFIDHGYDLDSPILKLPEEKEDVFRTDYFKMGEVIQNPAEFIERNSHVVSNKKGLLVSLINFAYQHPYDLDQVFSSPIMQNFKDLSVKEIPNFTKFIQISISSNPNVNFSQVVKAIISFIGKCPNDFLDLY
jgi:hypothetical protein